MLNELSLFVDESGSEGKGSKYYLLTLVFHNQSNDILNNIAAYEQTLKDKSLPDVPFHASPLMNGNDEYEGFDMATRKKLLAAFASFVRRLPIAYTTLLYEKKLFDTNDALAARMRRDVVTFLFDHLERFQSFDIVKVYYDDGQKIVSQTLRSAVGYALAKDSVLFRSCDVTAYRLSQVADLLCTLELTAHKYENKESTPTDEKVFGGSIAFKTNYLKNARRKRMN